jgi:hypothetical protein
MDCMYAKLKRFGARPLVWVALAAASGCGAPEEPWDVVYPTSGVVKFHGQPLAGALVTLIPQDQSFPNSVRPTAFTGDDGTFEVGTHATADGAPAGEYKVLVQHFPTIGTADNPQAGPNDLPPQFAKAETTTLRITIAEGPTELQPFEIE